MNGDNMPKQTTDIVIYTTTGKALKFKDVKDIDHNGDVLYFKRIGNQGDGSVSFFPNIAGHSVYTHCSEVEETKDKNKHLPPKG